MNSSRGDSTPTFQELPIRSFAVSVVPIHGNVDDAQEAFLFGGDRRTVLQHIWQEFATQRPPEMLRREIP